MFEGVRPVHAVPTAPAAATSSSTPGLLSEKAASTLDSSPSTITSQDSMPLTSSATDPKAQSLSGGQASPETIKVVANDGSQHYYPQRQVYTQPAPSSSSSPPIKKRDSALATSDTATVASDDAATSASSKAQYRAPANPRLPTGYVYPMPSLLRPGVGVGEVRCHYDRQRSGLLHCTNGYSYTIIAPEPYADASSDQTVSSSSSSSPMKKPSTEKRSSGASAAVPQEATQAASQGGAATMSQGSLVACPCQTAKSGSSKVPIKKRSLAPINENAPNPAPAPAASGIKSGSGSPAAMGVGGIGSGDPYFYAPITSGVQSPEPRRVKGKDWWDAFGEESDFDADELGRSKYAGSSEEKMRSKPGVASTGTEARAACATCGSGSRAAYGQGQAHAESAGKKKSKQAKRAVSAEGGCGPEAVSVPIHIPLFWDGKNVISPPGYKGQFDAAYKPFLISRVRLHLSPLPFPVDDVMNRICAKGLAITATEFAQCLAPFHRHRITTAIADTAASDQSQDIGIAVSGGVDSMALATLLARHYSFPGSTTRLHALIVDHKLRDSSTTEAAYVAQQVQLLGITPQVLTLDWTTSSSNGHKSIDGHSSRNTKHGLVQKPDKAHLETQARLERYKVIAQRCHALQIQDIFVGHHAGDQVETTLFRFTRASGIDGLSGIQGVAPVGVVNVVEALGISVIRPLLTVDKARLRATCEDAGVKWVEDESNKSLDYQRNVIRHYQQHIDALVGQDTQSGLYPLSTPALLAFRDRMDHHRKMAWDQGTSLIPQLRMKDAGNICG
ncbi:hypothetical protein BGZ72_010448 [Mortierella alpina]|nr:hypothetical protein BGZ72_010448 [Mortierella alpina]